MSEPIISLIMAHDELGGIGMDNRLPWPHCKEDMGWLVKHTKGKVVVMGRKTWESLPVNPLPDRTCVVLTGASLEGVETFRTVEDILERYKDEPEIMVMGGGQTYKAFSEHFSRAYITRFHSIHPCDVSLVSDDRPWDEWDLVFFDHFTSDRCTFTIHESIDDPGLDIFFTKGMVSEKE